MFISVVIPTFQRPDYLLKTLNGLVSQKRKPDQVVIGTRQGDDATTQFLAGFQADAFPIFTSEVSVPGVIASMNAAITKTTGDLVCLLDDDAEPLPEWMEKVEAYFLEKPRLGAVGGRDLLQDHPEWRPSEPTTESVGLITKYGKIIGNHHCGHGPFRHVDLLKGCNIGVRGDLLREIGIETALLGQGAQVHWELALCLDIKRRGYDVAYDPSLQIIHHIAPRLDDDQIHRGQFSRQGLYDMAYNEQFVIHSRLQSTPRIAHFVWSTLVGAPGTPGLAHYLKGKLRRQGRMEQKLMVTLSANWKGKTAGLKWRSQHKA